MGERLTRRRTDVGTRHPAMVETHRRLVLSREDDLRFEGDGVAAAGVVQAMLLTRRLLLVGYSLSDDNFHRLVHQAGQLGWEEGWHRTAIALTPDPLGFAPSIWKDRVEFVSTADPSEAAGDSEGAPTGASNPRRLAILLDAIAAEAAQPIAHLADPTYARLFSDEALALGDALRQVDAAVGRLGDADRRAADAVRAALRGVGWGGVGRLDIATSALTSALPYDSSLGGPSREHPCGRVASMASDRSISGDFDPGPERERQLVDENMAMLADRVRELREALIGTAGTVQALGAQVSLAGVAEADVAAAWRTVRASQPGVGRVRREVSADALRPRWSSGSGGRARPGRWDVAIDGSREDRLAEVVEVKWGRDGGLDQVLWDAVKVSIGVQLGAARSGLLLVGAPSFGAVPSHIAETLTDGVLEADELLGARAKHWAGAKGTSIGPASMPSRVRLATVAEAPIHAVGQDDWALRLIKVTPESSEWTALP